jgi:hypothetical protein
MSSVLILWQKHAVRRGYNLMKSRGWLFLSRSFDVDSMCVIIFVCQRACVWSTSLSQQKHNYHTIQLVAIHRRRTQINRFAIDAEIILFLPLTPLPVCRVLAGYATHNRLAPRADYVTSSNPSLFWLRLCYCFCIHSYICLVLSKFASPFAQQCIFCKWSFIYSCGSEN